MQPCTCEIGVRIARTLERLRTKPSRAVVLWTLVKDGKELTAKRVTNGPDDADVEIELDGELQPSQVYPTVAEALAAAEQERRRCLEHGWREVSPSAQ